VEVIDGCDDCGVKLGFYDSAFYRKLRHFDERNPYNEIMEVKDHRRREGAKDRPLLLCPDCGRRRGLVTHHHCVDEASLDNSDWRYYTDG